jgi:predicted protein tyrosine phosphatase
MLLPMQIYVYSRLGLEAARPHEVPHVIISITSAPTDRARLPENEHTLAVLRLGFPDYDTPSLAFPDSELFSVAQARQIWATVVEHRAAAQRILVHCEAGISRSSAVAAAVARFLGEDEQEFLGGKYHPNARVYRMLVESTPPVPA